MSALSAQLIAEQTAEDERADLGEILTEWRVQAHLRAKFAAPKAVAQPKENQLTPLQIERKREGDFYLDSGLWQDREVGQEISDQDRKFAFSAEGEFLRLCKAKTGESIPDEKLKQIRDDNAKLLALSFSIADRMETAADPVAVREALAEMEALAVSAGGCGRSAREAFQPVAEALAPRFRAYRDTPFGLWRYFVHSRHVEKIPAFRRITFIPYVATQLRGPMLSALEAFLAKHLFSRFWTFTSGKRVPLSGVRDRCQYLHRRLSQLNGQRFMETAGVRLVFRSTELGTPETNEQGHALKNSGAVERGDDGQLYFHVHAHTVALLVKGALPGEKWKRLLRKVHAWWGHHWDDGGSIREARECVKYVTKPTEMLKLTGAELVALSEQLSGLHLVQPMAELAKEIKARDGADLRLVTKRTPDGPVFAEVKNWNRHNRRTRAESMQDAEAKLTTPDKDAADMVRVVARLLPGYGPCGVAEPRVVVMAQRWDETAVRADKAVAKLIERTASEFWAGSAIRVHTCSATVMETRPFAFVAKLDPPRIPLSGAEMAGFAR